MKCENCGEILSGNKCLNCGFEKQNFQTNNNEIQNYNNGYNQNNTQNLVSDDKPSGMAAFIAFLLPEAGLTLYFLNRKTKPTFAKSFKKGFLIRIILSIVAYIFITIIVVISLILFSLSLFESFYF